MTFFVDLASGLASGILTDQIKELVRKNKNVLTDTLNRVKDGSLGVFIFGPQGTGKTTLMNVLAGELQINDIPVKYDSSVQNQEAKYGGHLFFRIYSAPGQDLLTDAHWPDLFREMQKYKRVICIFCVSYGCHSTFDTDASSDVEGYLYERRGVESKLFLKFCQQLSAYPGRAALMLLATKQDLWWNNRDLVQKHYSRAAFSKGMRLLGDRKKAVGFISAISSASLSIQNLLSAENDLLVATVSGYDQLVQRANYLNFLRELDQLTAQL